MYHITVINTKEKRKIDVVLPENHTENEAVKDVFALCGPHRQVILTYKNKLIAKSINWKVEFF